ncbi:MAG: nucleoside 2-deoxyribosyltransferase [Brevinema sp.]
MKIYIAAPLFNPRELAWNEKICKVLEELGHDVFLPQRDGGKSAELMKKATSIQEIEDIRAGIFERDFNAVTTCDILVFVTDGAVLDVGACAELGIAKACNILTVAIDEEARSFIDGRMNLFVEGCITKTVNSLESLVEYIESKKNDL